MNVLSRPLGFPPSPSDLGELRDLAQRVASAFSSRLVVADFARHVKGGWFFIQAGPGTCAGTAHQGVFRAVAARLQGRTIGCAANACGGIL